MDPDIIEKLATRNCECRFKRDGDELCEDCFRQKLEIAKDWDERSGKNNP